MSFPPQQGPFGPPQPPQRGGFGQGGGFPPGGGFGGGPQRVETSGKATTALVLGIVGIVACPLICSILAIVFGAQGKSEIDRSGGHLTGRGQAQAGFVLGWIGLALWGAFAILIVIGIAADDSSDFSALMFASLEALIR